MIMWCLHNQAQNRTQIYKTMNITATNPFSHLTCDNSTTGSYTYGDVKAAASHASQKHHMPNNNFT